jgi:arabinogalactan oligomer/maltooligosaccharide transport system substrate-binding protein
MKKNLVALMACLLTAASLGSCDNQPTETQKEVKEINVWATEKEMAVIDKVIGDYNKTAENEEIKINFTAIAEGDAGNTLAKDPTVKNAPALFLCADDHINELKSKSIIAEIKGERKAKVEANNSEVAVQGVTQDGKMWGYPVTSDNGYFLWYNNGVEGIGDKIDSLEELLAHAKSLGKSVLMDVGNGWYANSFIMSPQACGVNSLKWVNNAEGKVVYETTSR